MIRLKNEDEIAAVTKIKKESIDDLKDQVSENGQNEDEPVDGDDKPETPKKK